MSRSQPSAIDLLAAAFALADPHLDGAFSRLLEVVADPRRELAGRADEHHIGDRNRRRDLHAAARGDLRSAHATRVADRTRLLMLGHQVEVLDDHLPLARARVEDPSLLAAVLAGQHLDGVALLQLA